MTLRADPLSPKPMLWQTLRRTLRAALPIACSFVLLGTLSLTASAAWAQDPGFYNPRSTPGSTLQIPPPAHDLWIPSPPEEDLLRLTSGLYQHAASVGAEDCKALGSALRDYLDEHETEIERAADLLSARLKAGGEGEIEALATFLQERLTPAIPNEGRRVIYECVKAKKPQGRRRPVSKQMRRFHNLQKSMIEAAMGPLD